jgi:hypothetical protein
VTATVVACLAAAGYGDLDVKTVPKEKRPDESVALYTNPTVVDLHDIPRTRVLDHTMHRALEDYVARRIPDEELTDVMADEGFVDVHGIYPGHAYGALRDHGYKSLRRLPDPARTKTKPFNSIRPEYWLCKDAQGRRGLVLAVTPGEDYIRHYGAILRHAMWNRSVLGEEMLTIQRYPKAEQSIAGWTPPADGQARRRRHRHARVRRAGPGGREGRRPEHAAALRQQVLLAVPGLPEATAAVPGARRQVLLLGLDLLPPHQRAVRRRCPRGHLLRQARHDDQRRRPLHPRLLAEPVRLMRHDSLEVTVDLPTPR